MISIVHGLVSVWRRDFGSETFWGERIGAAYAKAGPQALCGRAEREQARDLTSGHSSSERCWRPAAKPMLEDLDGMGANDELFLLESAGEVPSHFPPPRPVQTRRHHFEDDDLVMTLGA